MDRLLLEINDCGIRLLGAGGEIVVSPGFVTVAHDGDYFGDQAEARVKRLPTHTEYRFWERLGVDPLELPNRLAQTQADLAYRHLESIRQHIPAKAEVAVAIASDMGRDQLSLLLGMLQRLEIQVAGFIDNAVLDCRRLAPGRQLQYLDLHLHRTVLSEMAQGQDLQLEQAHSSVEAGLMRLRDAWSLAITRLFVQSTRFDPQHDAQVEQQLYDRLGEWLAALNQESEIDIELNQGETRFLARLNRQLVIDAALPVYRRLLEFLDLHRPSDKPLTLALSHRLLHLPGLLPLLEALPDTRLQRLQQITSSTEADQVAGLWQTDGGVTWIRQKPWFRQDDASRHDTALSGYKRQTPTHVLYGAHAYALGEAKQFWVGKDAEAGITLDEGISGVESLHFQLGRHNGRVLLSDMSGATKINRKPLSNDSIELGVGDRISLGEPETELLMIRVEEH